MKDETIKPQPFPWSKLSIEEVSEHRNFDCLDYRWCLDYAADRHWENWTCLFCERFKAIK